jgi:hypothetical protein
MEANTDKRYPPPNTYQIDKLHSNGKSIFKDFPKDTERSNKNGKNKDKNP